MRIFYTDASGNADEDDDDDYEDEVIYSCDEEKELTNNPEYWRDQMAQFKANKSFVKKLVENQE